MTKELELKDNNQPVEGQDFIKFEYADVFFECNRCGHLDCLSRGIEHGLSFELPATDKHEWRMVCNNCKNMMRIFCRASSNAIIEERKAEKAKHAAEQLALEKAKENELKEKDKKKKSTKGSTKRSKRTDEVDSEGRGLVVVDNEDR